MRPRLAGQFGSGAQMLVDLGWLHRLALCQEGCVTQHQSGPQGLSVGAASVRALEKKIFQECLKRFVRLLFTVVSHLADQVNDVLIGTGDGAALRVILDCASGKKDTQTASPMAQLLFAVLHNPLYAVDGGGWLYIAGEASSAQLALVPPGAVSASTWVLESGVAEHSIRIHLAQLQPDSCTEGPVAYCVAALFCAVVVRLIDSEHWDTEPVAPVRDSADRWCCLPEYAQTLWSCRNRSHAQTAAAALLELLRASVVRYAKDTYSILVLPVTVHVHAMFHEKDSKPHRDSAIVWANSALSVGASVSAYAEWEEHHYGSSRSSLHDRPEDRVKGGLKDKNGFHERYVVVVCKHVAAGAAAAVEVDDAAIPVGALSRVQSDFAKLADELCIPQSPVCSDPAPICRKRSWRLVLPHVQISPPASSSQSAALVGSVSDKPAAVGEKRKSDHVREASPVDLCHVETGEPPLAEDDGAAGETTGAGASAACKRQGADDADSLLAALWGKETDWPWDGSLFDPFSNGESM